jgi:hypothetical protein
MPPTVWRGKDSSPCLLCGMVLGVGPVRLASTGERWSAPMIPVEVAAVFRLAGWKGVRDWSLAHKGPNSNELLHRCDLYERQVDRDGAFRSRHPGVPNVRVWKPKP